MFKLHRRTKAMLARAGVEKHDACQSLSGIDPESSENGLLRRVFHQISANLALLPTVLTRFWVDPAQTLTGIMFFHARAGKHGFSAAVQLEHGGRRTREVNPGTGTGNRRILFSQ